MFFKVRNKRRMSTLITINQKQFWKHQPGRQIRKVIKEIQFGKEDIKLSLFSDDIILLKEIPKDSTENLLELINEFGKVAGYKINTQKSAAFLYINNERSEIEIQKAITFTIASKRIKCLGINLPKETKDLYSKNCKMLMKEIEDNTNR